MVEHIIVETTLTIYDLYYLFYHFSTCSNVHYDCDKHPVWVPTQSAVWAKTGRGEYFALDCEMLTVRAPPDSRNSKGKRVKGVQRLASVSIVRPC